MSRPPGADGWRKRKWLASTSADRWRAPGTWSSPDPARPRNPRALQRRLPVRQASGPGAGLAPAGRLQDASGAALLRWRTIVPPIPETCRAPVPCLPPLGARTIGSRLSSTATRSARAFLRAASSGKSSAAASGIHRSRPFRLYRKTHSPRPLSRMRRYRPPPSFDIPGIFRESAVRTSRSDSRFFAVAMGSLPVPKGTGYMPGYMPTKRFQSPPVNVCRRKNACFYRF